MWAGIAYQQEKKFKEAIAELELCVTLNSDILNLGNLGQCYGMAGEQIKARDVIKQMKAMDGVERSGNNYIGSVYASVGDWIPHFSILAKPLKTTKDRWYL